MVKVGEEEEEVSDSEPEVFVVGMQLLLHIYWRLFRADVTSLFNDDKLDEEEITVPSAFLFIFLFVFLFSSSSSFSSPSSSSYSSNVAPTSCSFLIATLNE